MFWTNKKLTDEELCAAVKKEAQKFFGRNSGSHDWDHTLRVLENCRVIGQETGAELFILELAAYLHDVGREQEAESRGQVCHAKIGAAISKKILEKLGAKKETVEAVVDCVKCHRSKNENIPQSTEARALFDADKLDALGAVGLVRLFLFASEVGAGIHNKESDLTKTQAYSNEDTAFREFYLNVRFLKEKMMTEPGKRLGRERHDHMVVFFENFFCEVGADDKFFQMLKEIKNS